MDVEQEQLVKKRVPKICPFCKGADLVEWSEFKVLVGRYYYIDEEGTHNSYDAVVQVFCTRCDEEVREEDIQ